MDSTIFNHLASSDTFMLSWNGALSSILVIDVWMNEGINEFID